MVFGPVPDTRANKWRKKFNKKLQIELGVAPVTRYIKEQKIQWLGHIMRKSEKETIKQSWNRSRKGKYLEKYQGRGG